MINIVKVMIIQHNFKKYQDKYQNNYKNKVKDNRNFLRKENYNVIKNIQKDQ